MKNPSLHSQAKITAARRGQIIQRVIVDGRTSAEVAAFFGLPRRLVEVWVADFRRHGMASLCQEAGRTVAAEMFQLTISRPLRTVWRKLSVGLWRFFTTDPVTPPLPLRRSNTDGPR